MPRVPVAVPDLGGATAKAVELLVPAGPVQKGQALLTLETDKATADLESEYSGQLVWVIERGASLKAGDIVAYVVSQDAVQSAPLVPAPAPAASAADATADASPPTQVPKMAAEDVPVPPRGAIAVEDVPVYAGPGVRFLARQMGVNLAEVQGTGRAGRVLAENIYAYVKQRLRQPVGLAPHVPAPELPDFTRFGPVESQALTQVEWRTGQLTYRAWAAVPQVTHYAEADITDLEALRQQVSKPGKKITVLPYLIRSVVQALKAHPRVNASLSSDGRELILKHYFHIAVAVETDRGLVVPVVRNCDRLTIADLAQSLQAVAERARAGKFVLNELSGGCITVSSLGHIGGVGFSPIVREPEVAIVGVSRARMVPRWDLVGQRFEPRMVLPFSLTYDHRVIDGALAARFCETVADGLQRVAE